MIRREELSKIFRGNYGNRIFPPPISDEILENFPSEEDMIVKEHVLTFPRWLMDVITQSFDLDNLDNQYDYIVENSPVKPRRASRNLLRYPNFDLELDPIHERVTLMLYFSSFRISLIFDRIRSGMPRIRVIVGREAETPGKYCSIEKIYISLITSSPRLSHLETLLKIESMINSAI